MTLNPPDKLVTLYPGLSPLVSSDNNWLPGETELYAAAYRPIVRPDGAAIDAWPVPLAVGKDLPTLPLALNAELCLPIDLEATYTVACNRRRLG
jgi:hypothetical protein